MSEGDFDSPFNLERVQPPATEVINHDKLDELLDGVELEPNERVLFHGTPTIFSRFQTPKGSSKMDVTSGGVTYFYDDVYRASRFNGVKYVCIAKVKSPVSYAEQRKKQGLPKKKGKYTRGVWVALPEDSKPIAFVKANGLRITRSELKRRRKK